MKKLNLWLLASLFVASFTLTSCSDDDDPVTPDVPNATDITVDDLVGTWTMATTDNSITYTFTKTELTISYAGQEPSYKGPYTLADGEISYGQDNSVAGSYSYPETYSIGLLRDKAVLVLKTFAETPDGVKYEELAMILYKQGKTISTNTSEIQGSWHWYMHGSTDYIRTGLKFEGSNFELVITPWGEKYVGTYNYANGILTLNVSAGYTSRQAGTGYGFGEGSLDPATLEGTWNTLDRENWHVEAVSGSPFIVNGTEAYGCVANLMCIYHKK